MKAACPVGPSSAAARESDCGRPHPRCLPPSRPLCRPSRPSAVGGPDPNAGFWFPLFVRTSEWNARGGLVFPHRTRLLPTPFVSSNFKVLTGSVVLLGQPRDIVERLVGPSIPYGCSALVGFCVWKVRGPMLSGSASPAFSDCSALGSSEPATCVDDPYTLRSPDACCPGPES
jgi:hypothetical protein